MKCGEWRAKATHKITIQVKSLVGDDYGGQTNTWTNETTPWAMITPLSGRELFKAQQLESSVSGKMVIRYQSALKNTESASSRRVSYDGRFYSIKYIQNLDSDLKHEGKTYQVLYVNENGAENE